MAPRASVYCIEHNLERSSDCNHLMTNNFSYMVSFFAMITYSRPIAAKELRAINILQSHSMPCFVLNGNTHA